MIDFNNRPHVRRNGCIPRYRAVTLPSKTPVGERDIEVRRRTLVSAIPAHILQRITAHPRLGPWSVEFNLRGYFIVTQDVPIEPFKQVIGYFRVPTLKYVVRYLYDFFLRRAERFRDRCDPVPRVVLRTLGNWASLARPLIVSACPVGARCTPAECWKL